MVVEMANCGTRKLGVTARNQDLRRIEEGLRSAGQLFRSSCPDLLAPEKEVADVAALEDSVDAYLQRFLPEKGEGWLSEESEDDCARLATRRVWIVDPLDGTREFSAGIPEWSISIGLIEDGLPIAGGVFNPATDELFLGAVGYGVTLNGEVPDVGTIEPGDKPIVLASRSEVMRGEWDAFCGVPFRVVAMGSVAYKLARVAAGLADATWTWVPKHEWDVAAGVALAHAAGKLIRTPDARFPLFNRPEPLFGGLFAFARSCLQLLETEPWPRAVRARTTG